MARKSKKSETGVVFSLSSGSSGRTVAANAIQVRPSVKVSVKHVTTTADRGPSSNALTSAERASGGTTLKARSIQSFHATKSIDLTKANAKLRGALAHSGFNSSSDNKRK